MNPVAAAPPDRKTDILLAAERLFALNGYHAVTIRQIAHAAGVPPALVGYYYGQKHALFNAIFAHWNHTIAERLAALQSVREQGGVPDAIERVVSAFVDPVLRLRASADGEWYALLLTRGLNELGRDTDRAMREYFDPLANAFIEALMASFPDRSRVQVAWCYQFMLGALLHHIGDARVTRLSGGVNEPHDSSAQPLLCAFLAGGMRQAMVLPFASTPLTPTHTKEIP